LGDGKAGFGQPRRAADQHHEEDEGRHGEEPEPNSPAIVKVCRLSDGGRSVRYGHGDVKGFYPERRGGTQAPPFVSNMTKAQTAP
jgi:hypothetical protein